MRLGVIAEKLSERLALKLNVAPEPLLETQMAFSMARSIMTGVRLGVFEAAADGPRPAAAIAEACGTQVGATEKLLDTLTACGYFEFRRGSYALTPKSTRWLLRRSPGNLCDKLLFQFHEWDMVERYEEFVRTGEAQHFHASGATGEYWRLYQRAMRSLAGLTAGEVAARLPIPPGARDLLDLGGSHGYYSVCLCRKLPKLRAVIVDLPDAVAQAAPILAEEGMGDRVSHRSGDVLADELGERTADIVFMSQLVHHFTDEQNRALMKKVARALRPKGVCVISDSIRARKPGAGGQAAALLDLYFAMLSESGTWPLEAMQDWFGAAGLTPLEPIWLRTLPGGALVAGRKPA
jgi:SAM-dependent methyltransferase